MFTYLNLFVRDYGIRVGDRSGCKIIPWVINTTWVNLFINIRFGRRNNEAEWMTDHVIGREYKKVVRFGSTVAVNDVEVCIKIELKPAMFERLYTQNFETFGEWIMV